MTRLSDVAQPRVLRGCAPVAPHERQPRHLSVWPLPCIFCTRTSVTILLLSVHLCPLRLLRFALNPGPARADLPLATALPCGGEASHRLAQIAREDGHGCAPQHFKRPTFLCCADGRVLIIFPTFPHHMQALLMKPGSSTRQSPASSIKQALQERPHTSLYHHHCLAFMHQLRSCRVCTLVPPCFIGTNCQHCPTPRIASCV